MIDRTCRLDEDLVVIDLGRSKIFTAMRLEPSAPRQASLILLHFTKLGSGKTYHSQVRRRHHGQVYFSFPLTHHHCVRRSLRLRER